MEKMQKLKLAPDVREEMLNAEFWLREDDYKIIMNEEEIESFNFSTYKRAIKFAKEEVFLDLKKYPEELRKKTIREIMEIEKKAVEIKQKRYYNRQGVQLSDKQKKLIIENSNSYYLENEVEAERKIDFAVLVKRSSIKKYPTNIYLAPDNSSKDLDLNQLTALSVGTPCAVLAESRDQKWLFIQAKLYRGWVNKENAALAKNKEQALAYLENESFLVVTESRVETEPNPFAGDISNLLFQMGDKIPLVNNDEIPDSIPENNSQAQSAEGCYVIWLPTRKKDGTLKLKKALIARSNDLKEGFLAYSRANIIKQAFKLLGERYGWGGLYKRRDCSRFIMDIYRTVGIELPRDSNVAQQKIAAGKSIGIKGGLQARKKCLDRLEAGDALYMKGHVMMYLGKKNDQHYLIHSASGYSKKVEAENRAVTVHGVFVMKAEQFMKDGKGTYLEAFNLARKFSI